MLSPLIAVLADFAYLIPADRALFFYTSIVVIEVAVVIGVIRVPRSVPFPVVTHAGIVRGKF
jgi:hypothetical protein